ncbi:MAG TPA: dTDP-4-dehydrorhamnose 3,5-epimerase family protein, partial [Xanthobacteraceae bacterium]|nr:dTDP-4-dehydrorhamnose 3,5-epimerase family protein [Xanthobacteraceae bacterium]
MQVRTTEIPGVLLLTPRYFNDARGYFVETYNARAARDTGLTAEFVQD